VLENKWREDRLPDGSEKCMLDMLPRGIIVREAYAIVSFPRPRRNSTKTSRIFSPFFLCFFSLFFFISRPPSWPLTRRTVSEVRKEVRGGRASLCFRELVPFHVHLINIARPTFGLLISVYL